MMYITLREKENIGVRDGENVIWDSSIPGIVRVMSVDTWIKEASEVEKNVRK